MVETTKLVIFLKKNFKQDRKYFKGIHAYQNAIKWMQRTFEKVDLDFIKYETI